MSVIVTDAIFLRRPKFDYICPPVCETFVSGSSFPFCIASAVPLPPAPTEVVIECADEIGTLSWHGDPTALQYTIYRADDPENPTGSYSIFADGVHDTSFPVPCNSCYRVSAITLDGESELSGPVCSGIPPEVITDPATDVLADTATLHGRGNPLGSETTVYFEWGTDTSYGNATALQNIGSGINSTAFSEALSGLSANTEYHFRAVAVNSFGTVFGEDVSFTTRRAPPSANMWLWLKADAITGKNDGDVMNTTDWPDSSGNNRGSTVFLSGGITPPFGTGFITYHSNVQNGLPAVRIPPTNPFPFNIPILFKCNTGSGLPLPFTVFVVYSFRGTTNAGHRAISSTFGGTQHWLIGPYTLTYNFYNGNFIPGPATAQNQFVYQSVRQETGNAESWVNGISQGTNTDNTALNSIDFGGESFSGTESLDGDIAEVIIYSSALSVTDRQTVEAYLAEKWGIV